MVPGGIPRCCRKYSWVAHRQLLFTAVLGTAYKIYQASGILQQGSVHLSAQGEAWQDYKRVAANSKAVPHMAEGAEPCVKHSRQTGRRQPPSTAPHHTGGYGDAAPVPVSIYHTWNMLEDHRTEHLPYISPIETFGCELTLLDADTQVALQDPVQEELWNTNHFCLVVHECFRCLENNKPLQGLDHEDCPKAIRVPASETGILEAKAFHLTMRVRHACSDGGFRIISPQAWRYCHSLRIVKLPDTVVTLGFQGCCSLQVAEMPGCVEFGFRVFSECCALERVGNIVDGGSHLAIGAIVSQYAFEECAKLAHLSLPHVRAVVDGGALTSQGTIQSLSLGGMRCSHFGVVSLTQPSWALSAACGYRHAFCLCHAYSKAESSVQSPKALCPR